MSAQAPAVAAQSDSPLPPDSIRLRKEAAAAAARTAGHTTAAKPPGSRRGSTASWLHPLSSTEMPNSDVPRSPVFQRNGHATGSGNYLSASKPPAAVGPNASPLQSYEVEAHRVRAISGVSNSTNKSDSRGSRGYTKFTGLLTRRSKESKARNSLPISNQSGSQLGDSHSTQQPTTTPDLRSPSSTTMTTRKTETTTASTAAPNPLQRNGAAERGTTAKTTDSAEVHVAGDLQLDDGGYQWPAQPFSSNAAGSHGRASVSRSGAVTTVSSAPRSSLATSGHQGRARRELSVSPLIMRASPHATLRRDGASTPSTVRTASPGLNTSVAQFVPLGSADLADGHASPTHLQRLYNFSGAEEEKSTASVSQRNRSHRPRLVSASSLSGSTSQSLGLGGSTRFLQALASRQLGDTDTSAHASMTARSLRDAKAALLRRAQPAPNTNGSGARVSRQHSFRRSQSNTSLSIAEPVPPSRSGRVRPSSREKRPGALAPPPLVSSGRAGSPQSIVVVDDEAARTVAQQLPPPLSFASPVTHPSLGFPVVVTAPTQDVSSGRSVHNLSVSNGARRMSRTEDNPLLEVMETSTLASQGGYEIGGGAPWWPSTGEGTLRSRTANGTSSSRLGTDRRTTVMSRDESGHFRSSVSRRGNFFPPRNPSGCYSPNRTGGYGSDEEDRNEEVRMRERHRSRVDEVLRQLNATMRSNAGDERGGGGGGNNGNGAASGRNNSFLQDAAGASQTDTSNASGWAGIGGGEWGAGLAAFGDASAEGNATASTSTATAGGIEGFGAIGGGGGGWLSVGGGASSDDWYTRMRKKAQEEEARAVAAAAEGAREEGTPSEAPLPTASGTNAPSRQVGQEEGSTTPTSSVATCASTHVPAAESPTTRRPSVHFISRRPLADRSTPTRRPMSSSAVATVMHGSPPSAAPSTTSSAATGTTTGTALSTPSTVTVHGLPPKARQPTKPTTSPTAAAAAARERFTRRVPSSARLQLSSTAADVAKPDDAGAAAAAAAAGESAAQPLSPSAQRAAIIAELESPETTPARTRFQPGTTSVPVHRAPPQPSADSAAPLPQLETAETYRRLSGMASVTGGSMTDASVSSAGGAGTTAPTPIYPVQGKRGTDGFSPMPPMGGGANTTAPASSYRQFDSRRRCSLPRVLPTVNTSMSTPSPSAPQTQSSNPNSVHERTRSGVRHSTVVSSIPVASLSSSPSKTTGNASSAGAILPAADAPAFDSRAEGFEEEASASLRRRPSAPARTPISATARQPAAAGVLPQRSPEGSTTHNNFRASARV